MLDIAHHVRIFDPNPTDDLVSKRAAAIKAVAEKLAKLRTANELLQIAQDLASGLSSPMYELPEGRTSDLEAAIRQESAAFHREHEQLQILVCMMLAVLTVVEASSPGSVTWTKNEAIAVGCWLALSAVSVKDQARLENLRVELMGAARDLITRSSESSRQRSVVPDPSVKITELTDATKVSDAINKGLIKAVETLRNNAALDREEIDLLWWALGNWSDLHGKSYSSLSAASSAISAGIDAGTMMRRLPAEAHKHLAIRGVPAGDPLGLEELLASLAGDATPIREKYATNAFVSSFPKVFTLLSGITGSPHHAGKLTLREWGARALIEAAVIQVAGISTAV